MGPPLHAERAGRFPTVAGHRPARRVVAPYKMPPRRGGASRRPRPTGQPRRVGSRIMRPCVRLFQIRRDFVFCGTFKYTYWKLEARYAVPRNGRLSRGTLIRPNVWQIPISSVAARRLLLIRGVGPRRSFGFFPIAWEETRRPQAAKFHGKTSHPTARCGHRSL